MVSKSWNLSSSCTFWGQGLYGGRELDGEIGDLFRSTIVAGWYSGEVEDRRFRRRGVDNSVSSTTSVVLLEAAVVPAFLVGFLDVFLLAPFVLGLFAALGPALLCVEGGDGSLRMSFFDAVNGEPSLVVFLPATAAERVTGGILDLVLYISESATTASKRTLLQDDVYQHGSRVNFYSRSHRNSFVCFNSASGRIFLVVTQSYHLTGSVKE